ncbi:MAG: sigma 54-interacting transcriptional regulator [Pseudomonadota bacterium]
MEQTILVIDDEESIRFTLNSFLTAQGHKVVTADNYLSALELASAHQPDLIFADILLGKHSGIDLLREIKSRGFLCPVIMITGHPSTNTAAEAVRLGAFDYLSKPVKKEAVLKAARIALEHKALIDEKERLDKENERNRKHLEAIFRSVKDAILTVGADMRVIDANNAVLSVCGASPESLTGKPFFEIPIECLRSCAGPLKETLTTQRFIQEHRIECHSPGRPKQVLVVSISPLVDENARSAGAVLLLRDMTRLDVLERELKARSRFHGIIGQSRKLQKIYRFIEDLAGTDTTVLITGESGTGKELIAQALHYGGPRANKPMVSVNCSALSETLLESELFGHVKGAFTGAVGNRVGRIEAAGGGTLFLDEIGEISSAIQLKLLRVLQEKTFERVGDSKPVKVALRIITATNHNLMEKVRQGHFREDLFYRLKVFEITLPPLRDRLEDIPLLVNHFCERFNDRSGKTIRGITDEVLSAFMDHRWPGNIRELEHAIEHAFVLCRETVITMDHLPPEICRSAGMKPEFSPASSAISRPELLSALEKTGWNKARTARLLGISRQTMYRLISRHNIRNLAE